MPEGGKKHNKRQSGLSDEAEKRTPRWKIKSSCVWLIPGDVPGRRSMPVAQPAPRTLMVFRPKPFEPVQKTTHQALQPANDLHSSHVDSAKTDANSWNSGGSGSNTSDSSHIELARRLANDKTITGESTLEGSHAESHDKGPNSEAGFNHKADSVTIAVDGSTKTHVANQSPGLAGLNKETNLKPGILSGVQAGSADHSYDMTPLSAATASTTQGPPGLAGAFYLRKIIPALLLLLLLFWLASLGNDYFANRTTPATLAVKPIESTSITQAGTNKARLPPVPEEKPVYSEEPGQLPAVDINLSKIGRRSISGLRMLTHTVVRGDTLWDISKAYLKNPFRYPELAKLSHIKNPDLIYPGEIIHIHIKIRD